MEALTIFSVSVRLMRQSDTDKRMWIYCLIKAGDQTFCSKNRQVPLNGWAELINNKNKYEIQIPMNFCLFQLQIWDYDSQVKLGQSDVTMNDLPIEDRQKQFSINDKKISLNIIYERKMKQEQGKEADTNTMRVSYNKSDPNLKIVNKPSTGYVKKTNNLIQQVQTPKYESNLYGRWRVLPSRNDLNPFKLRL